MNRRLGSFAAVVAATAVLAAVAGATHRAAASPFAPSDSVWAATPLELVAGDTPVNEVSDAALEAGAAVLGTAPGIVLVDAPFATWGDLASVEGVELRRPLDVDIRPERAVEAGYGPTTGEAVTITLADAWHDAGFDGTGVKVGVIDYFDTKFWDVAEHGPLPVGGTTARCFDQGSDCTNEFFDGNDLGGEDHGVAVVEIIRDMAPGAEIYLGQAATAADYEDLVEWFASVGVEVVSRSLGSRFDGPGDGRGTLDEIVEYAVSLGMTWVNSGGNSGEDQYYRHAVRMIGDRVAFGPEGADTYLQMRGCIALAGMRWAGDWDLPADERTDYDLYVWDAPTGSPELGSLIASSTRRQTQGATPLELVPGAHCPASGRSVYLEVRLTAGSPAGDVLEILDYEDGMSKYTQAAHSAAVSVVDSALPGVVSVGAIDPPGSSTIAPYSSQGPTNDGRVAPQVVAPAGFDSTVYGESFSGTSASAPVVAGAAALFVGVGAATDPTSLGHLLRSSTVDRGASGPDTVYGYGELRLPDPPAPGLDTTPSRYVSLAAPVRFLDTRTSSPAGPAELIGSTWPGEVRRLPVVGTGGVPGSGVTSVAVNVVTVQPDRRSYVQVLPLMHSTLGGYSNLNADTAGQNRANFAIIPVASDGTIALYSTAGGDLIVDVLGYFERADAAVAAGRFVELPAAQRLLDTRTSGSRTPVASGATLAVPTPSVADLAEVAALVVTVTAVSPTSVGWLQAYPTDQPDVIGRTSTVNTSAGSNAAGTAIVPIGSGGVGIRTYFSNGGNAHIVVDAIGYFTSSAAAADTSGRFVAVTPDRAYDSRTVGGMLGLGTTVVVDASAAPAVSIPADARGVVWNMAMVEAQRRGYATVWAADQPQPATSSLNWSYQGEIRAAAVISAVDNGRVRVLLGEQGDPLGSAVGHLIADVFGYFT